MAAAFTQKDLLIKNRGAEGGLVSVTSASFQVNDTEYQIQYQIPTTGEIPEDVISGEFEIKKVTRPQVIVPTHVVYCPPTS